MYIFTSFPQHSYTWEVNMKKKLRSRNKSLDFYGKQLQKWAFNPDCAGESLRAGILESVSLLALTSRDSEIYFFFYAWVSSF